MASMEPSRKEIEIKLRFPSAIEAIRRIESLGAAPAGRREFEDNRVYDLPSGALRARDQLLRLRLRGSAATLTFKSRLAGDGVHKVCEEHETGVSSFEDADRILTALGFASWYRYQKYRTLYRLDGVEIAVDETPIGCFVELEGEPQEIDRLARRLGFRAEEFIRSTYRELHESTAGSEAGDLVFDAGAAVPDRP
jgi:adenylate cyclase class 2